MSWLSVGKSYSTSRELVHVQNVQNSNDSNTAMIQSGKKRKKSKKESKKNKKSKDIINKSKNIPICIEDDFSDDSNDNNSDIGLQEYKYTTIC